MFLTRWKFDPRLLTIKVANTKVAEGLHTIREKFKALQDQVKTSREKLPLEAVPARALVGELITKCNECSQQCSSLIQSTPNACIALHDHMQELYTKLTQLSGLLSAIQSSNTELRPFSFDPLTALIGHIGNSLEKLEKAALAENNRWFLPAAFLWSLVGIAGLFLAWNAYDVCAYVTGGFGWSLGFTYLLAFGASAAAVAMVMRQFYRCYRPNSKGLPAPQPHYQFWLESALLGYVAALGLTSLWYSKTITMFLTDYHSRDPGLTGFLAIVVIGGAIFFGRIRAYKTWPRQKNSYGSTRYARY